MLLETINDFNKNISQDPDKTIGLVPTMGALHQGHLSLIEQAKKDCDRVVVSIFVNPTQFNDPNDLSKYPRTLSHDIEVIQKIDKNIIIYVPSVDEIYPETVESHNYNFGSLTKYMEGQYRKGHFDGVATVLNRLFELLKPDKAYFGKKDYQQLAVVRKLVQLTNKSVEIIGCETYREANGLAKSSRNKLLDADDKLKAGLIYKCLKLTKSNFKSKSVSDIKKMVKSAFKSSENLKLEYFEIASIDDLIPTEEIQSSKKYRAFIAAYNKGVRLIDNIALN